MLFSAAQQCDVLVGDQLNFIISFRQFSLMHGLYFHCMLIIEVKVLAKVILVFKITSNFSHI